MSHSNHEAGKGCPGCFDDVVSCLNESKRQVVALQADLARVTGERDNALGSEKRWEEMFMEHNAELIAEREKNAALKEYLAAANKVNEALDKDLGAERARAKEMEEAFRRAVIDLEKSAEKIVCACHE